MTDKQSGQWWTTTRNKHIQQQYMHDNWQQSWQRDHNDEWKCKQEDDG